MKSLVPCPSCQRHVRASEHACPFCQSALPAALADGAIPAASQRMKRAAAFAFTATLALAGCGDSTTPAPADSAVNDNGGVMPLYGAPADVPATDTPSTDTPATDAPATDAPADTGGMMALYGGPPVDAATPSDASADTGPRDDGSVMALYGAVPADVAQGDATADIGEGGGGVRYGAPPADVWV